MNCIVYTGQVYTQPVCVISYTMYIFCTVYCLCHVHLSLKGVIPEFLSVLMRQICTGCNTNPNELYSVHRTGVHTTCLCHGVHNVFCTVYCLCHSSSHHQRVVSLGEFCGKWRMENVKCELKMKMKHLPRTTEFSYLEEELQYVRS
jgi:hypothetical protein